MKSCYRLAVIALALLLLGAAPEAVKLLNEGIAAAKRGDLKRAEGLIVKAIAIDSHEAPDYQVHFWHGVVLSGLGYDAAARKEWAVAGGTPEVKRRLGPIVSQQQRAENARSDAMFLSAGRTKSFRAGEDAMKAGKFDEARELYAHALSEPRQPFTMIVTHPIPLPPPPPPPPTGTNTATEAMVTESTMTTDTGATATATSTATSTTTSTTTSSATSTAPEAFEEIKKRFENLSPGTIAFNAPDRMKVSETATVTVRIAPKGEASNITGGLSGPTSTAPQEHITENMAAKLDGVGFEITALSPETQSVAGGGFAEWRWNVTAAEPGDHDLNVTIIAKFDQRERSLPTQSHHVHVDGDPTAAFKEFLEKNWQWLASVIVIPLIALLWKSRAKRKE